MEPRDRRRRIGAAWPCGSDGGSTNRTPGAILKLAASLTFDGGLAVDNVAEYALTVVAAPSVLAFEVAATPDPAVRGGLLLYTVTVSNLVARATDDVTVLLRVPRGLDHGGRRRRAEQLGLRQRCVHLRRRSLLEPGLAAGRGVADVRGQHDRPRQCHRRRQLIRGSFEQTATGVSSIKAIKTIPAFSRQAPARARHRVQSGHDRAGVHAQSRHRADRRISARGRRAPAVAARRLDARRSRRRHDGCLGRHVC